MRARGNLDGMIQVPKEKLESIREKNPKSFWGVSLAVLASIVGFWIRYLTADNLDYLHASDSYMIFRISQHIAYEGVFPSLDFLRYFPYELPTYVLHFGAPSVPAAIYNSGFFLIFDSYLDFAVAFTPLIAGITVFVAYFLGKEIWDKKAGVSSAFMVALMPAVMHRGSAGFFQKDQTGVLFMFISLLFFVRAWKYSSWKSGVISGLSLGIFSITWGGSSMYWLLLPLTVGTVILFNQDIERLIRAYTPTILIGGIFAASLNPHRFWIGDPTFLGNLGLLMILWGRYLVEELKLIESEKLKWFVPGAYGTGILLAILSPLYSQRIWEIVTTLIDRVTTPSGDVIAGTVAENQPIEPLQLFTEAGFVRAGEYVDIGGSIGFNPVELLGIIISPWTLSMIGFTFLTASILGFALNKFRDQDKDSINSQTFYGMVLGSFAVLAVALAVASNIFIILVMIPAGAVILAGIALAKTLEIENDFIPEENWVLLLPFFWFISNVFALFSMSRLAFLAGFPIAVLAGYGFSVIWSKAPKAIEREVFNYSVGSLLTILLAGLILIIGVASSAQITDNIQQSPGEEWYPTLEYLEQESDHGSSVLSWWDYGYWFQTLGERPSVADGGNHGYFTEKGDLHKVPHPIADFLTSEDPSEHSELLEKHSVDYIVLDQSMVSKYGAVSQISNRDNEEFESIQPIVSSNTVSQAVEQGEDLVFEIGEANILVPLEEVDGSVELTGAPQLQTPAYSERINCVITREERLEFHESPESDFCLAVEPYSSLESGGFQPVYAGLVPREISENTFVELYYKQGEDLEWVDRVDDGSSDTVHMWEVTGNP